MKIPPPDTTLILGMGVHKLRFGLNECCLKPAAVAIVLKLDESCGLHGFKIDHIALAVISK